MSIEWFRDLIIIIGVIVVIGVWTFSAVILYSIYRKTRSIVDSIEYTTKNIRGISSYATDEVIKPLVQIATLVQGMRQGINWIGKMFKTKEGGKNV